MPAAWPWRAPLSTPPVTVAAPAGTSPLTEPAAAAPVRPRGAGAWALATPVVMAAMLVLAAWLAWFTVDLLHNRLQQSSLRFDAATHRFERFWTLRDAARESVLAVRQDLSGTPVAAPAALRDDVERLARSVAALQAELAQPGLSALSRDTDWRRAAQALADTAGAGPAAADRARVQAQAGATLESLSRLGREARRSQSMATEFIDEVQDVRRQVLVAFAGIVAMLVLVVALAAQWVLVASRERASRRRAEQLAAVAEAERSRAEAVARDKARFLGMLSHELLTPLQSIWSTMDVIESRGRVDAADASFARLKESTRSLRGRISDLVDFAKMSSGRLETRIRGFQLDKLIDTALRDVEEALAARNLDVHWEAGPELALRVYSDPARLRQVIDNLLTNAIKYTERGGITIVAGLRRAEGLLRVEISDTGVGIEPEELSRLFEPFYRSPQTAGMAEGSGLGLAVVRSLVDLMGGSIQVESRPGQGTTVTVEVPFTEGVDAAAEAPHRIDAGLPVLVVDDARDARRAIADLLRVLGVEVVEAADGAGALAAAAQRDFQAIFLDMQMPDLTGYEVARRLRRPGDRHERTFLALVSAYNDLDDATVASVFDARIDKPASRKDLIAALARAAQARARAPGANETDAGRLA